MIRAFLPSTERICSEFSSKLCMRRDSIVFFNVLMDLDGAQGRSPNGY